jgi:hypothetical protein
MFCGGARAEHEIGFVEKFALAQDRTEALRELIPGTEDYYFYHALHFQNTTQKKELASILDEWRGRAPESPLLREIQHREALINYETDPQATLVYLKRTLEVEFNHAQQIPNAKPDLPTTLDQQLITQAAFLAQHGKSLEGLRTGALETLLRNNVPLSIAQLRQLLNGLKRPDIPGLTEAILKELADDQSGGFGSLPIHDNLLLNQMEALAKGQPELKNSARFIHKWLEKLQPSAEVNLFTNSAAREAWLERAWTFVKDLPPSFNSLKAHLLYHRLKHDWEAGTPSLERFLSYLKLPRNTPQVSSAFKRDESLFADPCNLSESFEPTTKLPTVENDETLVRNYLLKFLEGAADAKAFAPYVEEAYLRQAYAESNLVAGKGDAEKWFSMMSAAEIESLRERVDLEFDPANRWELKPEEDVTLALQVKNVPDLAVHIFEINTLNYHKSGPPAPFPNLNLDGLIANHEQSAKYAEAPVIRKKREFKFPEIAKTRGVWVIDFGTTGIHGVNLDG